MSLLYNLRHLRRFLYICIIMKREGHILVVDDHREVLASTEQMLSMEFSKISTLEDPSMLPDFLSANQVDVIMLDMNFSPGKDSGEEGLYWLRKIREMDPEFVVLLITAYGDVDLAVKAINEGGTDFIVKPWDPQKLIASLQTALELRKTRQQVVRLKNEGLELKKDLNRHSDPLIGNSPALKKVLDQVKKAAPTDANILILGENGSGKELLAQLIHQSSVRADQVFLQVDMAALPPTLFESELFGHKKGAFTDAHQDRTGRFEMASGGTLFLDEIGNLEYPLQSKLLNAVQTKSITPLGGSKPVQVDIRLISATNRNLRKLVSEKLFREDLFYRLNTICIEVPPLRERGEDISLIASYFFQKFGEKYLGFKPQVTPSVYKKLQSLSWPGNIRELKHMIENSIIMLDGTIVKEEHLMTANSEAEQVNAEEYNLASIEKEAISRALNKAGGNISQAAQLLDITRTTLYSKISKHGL